MRRPAILLFAILAAASGRAADLAAGERVFARCRIRHSVAAGAPSPVGPDLPGLFGREAGSIADYTYSPAMKQSGVVWKITEAAEKLRLIVRVLNRRAQTATGEGSPTRSEQAVLAWLEERGPTTPSVLAGLEQVRQQSMSQTLDAIVEQGWAFRSPHPSDRRQVLISLTKLGKGALNRGRRLRQAWLVEAMNTLLTAGERHALIAAIDLLDRIVRG